MAQPKKNKKKEPAQADFGFRKVAEAQKEKLVGGVFQSVASRYDLMNDVMSGGLHRLWKNAMVRAIPLHSRTQLLDVAGGTGDVSFRFLKRAAGRSMAAEATVCDINPAMLKEGKARAIDLGILKGIRWQQGNAENLPFADDVFDAYTVAFGIRNVTHRSKALKEALRVLKPGGKFLCLEFSHVANPLLAKAYDAYSFHVIPAVGEMITHDREAYQYLVESIRMFPAPDDFAAEMKAAGFSRVEYRRMTSGVVALHTGWKI